MRDSHTQIFRFEFTLGMLFCFWTHVAFAQNERLDFRVYGHLQHSYDKFTEPDDALNYFSLGEQDFFILADLHERISFLGETVVKYDGNTSSRFAPSIERAQVKCDYYKNHSLILGKIHSPVNYWNDVYHHGRVFFPTIDRPLSFTYLVPIHSLGIRAQGQNLGSLNWGYDVCLSNGINSTDNFSPSLNKSILASVHLRPIDGMRVQASYYNDFLTSHSPGVHIGHGAINADYKGQMNYELYSASAAYFGTKLEFLYEGSYNRNRTDSLGLSENLAHFVYTGWRIKERYVPYAVMDFINISDRDLHNFPTRNMLFILGFRYEITPLLNLKVQAERISDEDYSHGHSHSSYNFKIQFAYGF
jgi:hypothetical protein